MSLKVAAGMSGIIELGELRPDHIRKLAEEFDAFRIIRSLLWLKLVGAPSLDTIVVTRWEESSEALIYAALDRRRWTGALVRSDVPASYGLKPPGGHLCNIDEAAKVVKNLIRAGRAALLMEPCSRFDDVYSGNALIERESRWLQWEIVGPGFDLADINRGWSIPHERFETYRGQELEDVSALSALDIRNHAILGKEAYKQDWSRRVQRVGRFIQLDIVDNTMVESRVREYLLGNGYTLLLQAENEYCPLGYDLLCKIHAQVHAILWRLRANRLGFENCIIGFGVLGAHQRRLIFWDITQFEINHYKTTHSDECRRRFSTPP